MEHQDVVQIKLSWAYTAAKHRHSHVQWHVSEFCRDNFNVAVIFYGYDETLFSRNSDEIIRWLIIDFEKILVVITLVGYTLII